MALLDPCSVTECERASVARGYCMKHYKRWWKTGDPVNGSPSRRSVPASVSTVERFWSYVDRTGSCWLWTGTRSRKGYGAFSIGPRASSSQVRAHRFSWEMANGRAIPSDLLVRHSCDTPACVRPDHLLLGTIADNNRDRLERGGYARKAG